MFSRLHTVLDGGRREALIFSVLAVLLVLARSLVFLVWEHIDFDSDQAIVGLMAKHLSEFRTFPLFFYGQNYMLGVQSWFTAPFFWLARPSVALLKTPLVILNATAAILIIRSLSGQLGLRPAVAFVAALPFIAPTPAVAGSYLETLGSSGIEPLIYVLLLWFLRSRPVAFGALLALGFLHREFTMYAVPALVVICAADSTLWTREGLGAAGRWVSRMAAGFGLVWLIVDDAKMHLQGNSLLLQAQMLGLGSCFEVGEYLARIRYMFPMTLPVMSGGRTMVLSEFAVRSSAVVGSPLIGWLVAATMVLMLARIVWLWSRRTTAPEVRYGVYLALIGCCTLAVYPLACSANTTMHPIIRYLNLSLLFPIGCYAVYMVLERAPRLRAAVTVAFLLWGAANMTDSARQLRAAAVAPMPNPHRELTNFLLDHQIRYARANYWDAYAVSFLSGERVIVGSFGPTRIPEYERLVDENRATAVHIERKPCQGWTEVAAWCIQLPARP